MNIIWIVLFIVPLALAKKCPGGEYQCPDTATCCETPDESYGCCPLTNAVCCDDHIHCCPEHSKCGAGMCIQETNLNATAYKLTSKARDHPCPTEESSCRENYTCCSDAQVGIFGCCPLPDAVCCADASHCCPSGLICDLVSDRCVGRSHLSEDKSVATNPFIAIVMKAKSIASVICPGGEFQCPDDYTCCKLPSGSYGCCPFVNATCCSDHMHCCPQNLKCDATSKSCMQGSVKNMTWSLNKQAMKVPLRRGVIRLDEKSINSVICPGGEFQCPDDYTCCKLPSGSYGCCPFVNATCCSDHMHCCPQNLKCDATSKSCMQGSVNMTWSLNKQAMKVPLRRDVICPDQKLCPENTTCCQLESGHYGCCAYADGVCCSDHLHCCPSGYDCDVHKRQCVHSHHSLQKVLAMDETNYI